MELQGSVTIPSTPDQVWQALNNPDVLRLCIPGCEEVRQISPEEMHARVLLKLGPVRANFVGKVLITDVRPLQGYTLNFEGSGGSAGFAKGRSVITLAAVAEGTRLDYTAQASVAGKLGQIGGRLIDASARQLSERFFEAFKAQLSAAPVPALPLALAAPVAGLPVVAPGAPGALPVAAGGWFEKEKPRLLWFAAGVASTALGVWMGAHWLR
ncbi:CoxG family protein [Curvibacter sp. PAE-UM]|uniref:CoxG family protein n=1 Tax=Curvibacter sp. PAE-UM TaxID=1714344 RepID=UPI0009EC1D3D|nr:carbon monoxide dehydrogenase subunit G [Curvibacter sp. PAE-UM]